jgi:hypothetical protein
MEGIEDILRTAHISVSTATLKVVVNNLEDYKELFFPRSTQLEDDIFLEDPQWKIEMGFPKFVLSVSPWYEDSTLSVWVEWPFDLQELSDWLETFPKIK